MFSNGFTSISVWFLLPLLIIFHLTQIMFSPSTHLLICLSLETLTSTIRTDWSILVELIDLVNSAIVFISHTTLLRWLTFLPGSQAVTLTVLAFWISLFLLGLAFVLEWFSLYWEILIMLLSHFPLTFHYIHNRMPRFIALRVNFLVLTRIFFGIIWEKFHESISLNSLFLLLLVSFVGGFRLELMYISLIESIRSNLTLLHVFSWLCYSHISQKLLFSFVPKG